MSKILLFADAGVYNQDYNCVYPTRMAGVYRLATELREHNYQCQIIDHIFSFSIEEIKNICKKYIDASTEALGFSSTFWFVEHFVKINHSKLHGANRRNRNNSANTDQISNLEPNNYFLDKLNCIFETARSINPTIKFIVGGTQTQVILKFYRFDAAFLGYAENLIIKWLKYQQINKFLPTIEYAENGTPIYRYNVNTDEFNFQRSKILYTETDFIERESFSLIEISRGCIFKCKFCSYPLNGRKKLDYIKDMDSLREEFIYNYENYNITNYMFSDDTFNDSTYKIQLMHDMVKTLPFKIKFSCYLRIDLLHAHPEQIPLLKEMGIIGAFFGIETFNKIAAKNIGKGLDPEKIKQLLYDLKTVHWGKEVNISLGIIVGLPYETEISITEFLEWVKNEEQCLVDCVNPQSLFISSKKNKKDWASDFDLNYEQYGFTVDEFNQWTNHNGHYFDTVAKADEWTNRIFQAAKMRGISHENVCFGLFWVSDACRAADPPISFDEYLKMSNVEKYNWRIKNMYQSNVKILKTYRDKVLASVNSK